MSTDLSKTSVVTSESVKEVGELGNFQRQANAFTAGFGDGPGELPVEAGRYRLIAAAICPWAHRQVIVRQLLGLDRVISLGWVSPVRTTEGWRFSLDPDGRDPVLGIELLNEAYLAADPGYDRRGTVPALVDITTGKVVNNDYHHLSNHLETAWRPFHASDAPELYPVHLRDRIDEFNDWLFDTVNNGVYKCGFAKSQQAYDEAFEALFAGLDHLEDRLSGQRFLFGDFLTDADVRLYATLARFDVAYHGGFKANRDRLVDFEHLWAYARDLYAIPGFGSTTDFEAIKQGYFGSPRVIAGGVEVPIIPRGPRTDGWLVPSGRAERFGLDDPFLRG